MQRNTLFESWRTKMNTAVARQSIGRQSIVEVPGLMGRVRTYIARSRAERQLRQLDDHLLADIGVSRKDIGKSVWGAI
jgi:uncharacterized protein YjiS (DUF1127 family)